MSTQFHTTSRTRNRNILGTALLLSGVLASTMCFADDPTQGDVTSQAPAAAGGGTATGTGTGTGTTAVTKVTEATIATVEPHPALLELIKSYDTVKEQATSYMCDQAELIAKDNIGRPQVIKSLMVARGVTLETAQSTASRMIKLSKSPDQIKGLRDGSLTIRETLYNRKPAGTTEAAAGGGDGTAGAAAAGTGKKTDTEKKEDKYNRLLKEFTESAKASGFDLKSIIAGVTASLKDAGIK